MWDLTDGSAVRNLLTGNADVRKVAFEGRWCAAFGFKENTAVMDVWDFGTEVIENEDGTRGLRDVSDRIGEPSNGSSDDTTGDEYKE